MQLRQSIKLVNLHESQKLSMYIFIHTVTFFWLGSQTTVVKSNTQALKRGRTIVKIVPKLPVNSSLRIERRAIGVGLCSTRRNEHNWRDYNGSKHSAIVTL